LAIEPAHAETSRRLGEAWILLGDLKEADAAFAQSLTAAIAAKDTWGEMAAKVGMGDIRLAIGDLTAAQTAFTAARQLAEQLARHPVNAEWQRDLSVSHNKIGDVLVAQGDGPGALAAYRKGLAIGEALAARDPTNSQWAVDVVVSCAKLGSLTREHTTDMRRAYLTRGREMLVSLKTEGRLLPDRDWITWFDGQIVQLTGEEGQAPTGSRM
jgi:tetratricopeptide (TPR) repeat protein